MSRDFINIVEGRMQEIIENVWFQVPNEYIDKLLGGIIITGGGSNMRNIESAFRNHTHIDKIRVARFITTTVHASQMEVTAHNGMMNTVLGLLEKGDMNCAGEEITGDLFGGSPADQSVTGDPLHKAAPRPITEISGKGIVQTEEEKKKAEEEARRKREAEEEEQRRLEAEEAERLRREKRENSFWNKAKRALQKFGKSMIEEEE